MVWALDPDTGKRRNLGFEEERTFWGWAVIEVLRHTGVRIEELTELTHRSLVAYTLPSTGETIPLLQITPSETDKERLLVVCPDLSEVLAAIMDTRVRCGEGPSAPRDPGRLGDRIAGGADLDPAVHGWHDPVARVTVERIG